MRKRKPKKRVANPRVPRTRAEGTWTEAQYFSYIRGGLRRLSTRYPVKYAVRLANRRTVKGKRHKFEYQCAECNKWKKDKDVDVDHIIPAGSLRKYDDLPGFVERLFCEADGMQILCKICHKKKTELERSKR